MKKVQVFFAGVDYWSRPVFKDIYRKRYYCDVFHLVNGNIKEDEILGYYKEVGTKGIIFKGNDFDSEPMGDQADVEIVTWKEAKDILYNSKLERAAQ